MGRIYTAAEQIIGRSPLLELTHLEQEYQLEARVLAKLECFNPAGSAKDRVALAMIEDAEAKGLLKPGSVLVDVAIDQGGSIETLDRITTHADPYFVKHGVIHYSVANMPGAVPRTSTLALTGATLPYALMIANLGAEEACRRDPSLMKGLNTYQGHVTYKAVADDQNLPYADPATLF